ncbi:ATP-binding protein [Candidatus Woesearchaeota archaeon]|nr:ATP-binding protein [Candidatus Woesearchaeota archaeon]
MDCTRIKGKIIGGSFNKVIIRQKQEENIQLGELLVSCKEKILLQVYDLIYASQLSQQNLELISGMQLEKNAEIDFFEQELRNYTLAFAKNLVQLQDNKIALCKELPIFFSDVREITKDDFLMMKNPEKALRIGKLRSGNKVIDLDIVLDGEKTFSEHILIASSTGKGKSNLTSCLLYDCIDKEYCGILILDPHDEYYGRNKLGLKNHSLKEKVHYYTPYNPPAGAYSLRIHITTLKPSHFNGVILWSDAQKEAIYSYYKKYKEKWIEALLLSKNEENENNDYHDMTLAVVRRKLMQILDLRIKDNLVFSNSIFDMDNGKTTVAEVCNQLEKSSKVIIDTSLFSSKVEILLGSLFTTEIFSRYKRYKIDGILDTKPVISIVIEEAPRVLGKEIVQLGNIFSTIAREGRKFKVGLLAITQIPSQIPREILANMNTKIILGIEMASERQAIIESSAQDLTDDNRTIASLDKGEAIISSTFLKFATPVKIPFFDDIIKQKRLDFYSNTTTSSNSDNDIIIKRQFGGVKNSMDNYDNKTKSI